MVYSFLGLMLLSKNKRLFAYLSDKQATKFNPLPGEILPLVLFYIPMGERAVSRACAALALLDWKM